ncbi:MAG: TonB-dependent receptor [Bacteroidota bacterium]
MRGFGGVAALAVFASVTAWAQAPPDSLWEQDLGAVSVSPVRGATVPSTGGATRRSSPIPSSAAASPTLADEAGRLPGAHLQTNSRGEALVYLRGSGERQITVTLDGAPLAIPWDRRADLGLLPVWGLDRVTVATGSPSVAWGPNALGGTLALTSRRASSPGAVTEAGAAGGWPASGRVAVAHVQQTGGWGLALAADASARAGVPVARNADLVFSQDAEGLRTNTDRERAAVLARIDRGDVSLTLLHTETSRGIAPEGHLDPETERVRFWRYPVARQSLGVLNARARRGWWRLGAAAWGTASVLTIEQYEGTSYETVTGEEEDRDASGGVRVLAELPRAWGVFRAAAFGQAAQHRQRETDQPDERFRHLEGSLGIEAETGGRVQVSAGIALDALAPIETGQRPEAGPFSDVALHLGAVTEAGGLRLRAGGGRKTRFPSMRELFGGALGRFVVNPDLQPETAWLAEAGLEVARPAWQVGAVAFARDVDGTIEQRQLDDGRRQRVNLGGSWAVGLEVTTEARPATWLRLDGAATVLRQRSDAGERLTERPGALARLGAEVNRGGWRLGLGLDGIGGVVSPVPGGLEELPGAILVSADAARRWIVGRSIVEVSVRLQNATDALHVPQVGLPAPGRQVTAGLRVLG